MLKYLFQGFFYFYFSHIREGQFIVIFNILRALAFYIVKTNM